MNSKKIKILFVSHTSNLGGAEVVLLRFLMLTTSFDPYIILPNGPLFDEFHKNNLKVLKSKHLGKLNKEKNRFWIFSLFMKVFRSLHELRKHIKEVNPDIIQSNNIYTAFYCLLPCILSKIPFTCHVHDFVGYKRALNLLIRFISKFCDKIIAVSDAVKQDLIEAGVTEDQIKIIYNSISDEYLTKDQQKIRTRIQTFKKDFNLVLGVAGTIEERKGHLECVQGLSLINNKKRTGLVIIGETHDLSQEKYRAKLLKKIDEFGLKKHILFLGRIEEIKSFFEEIDVFVHYPKFPDPLPTVVLEAIALDCPVVVADHGGNLEIVQHGRWGTIVKANNPPELAKVLLAEKPLPLNPGGKKEFLEFFSHHRKEKLHIDLYNELNGLN